MGNKKEFTAIEFCYRIAGEEHHSVIYEFDGKFMINELKFTGPNNFKMEELDKDSFKELLKKIFENGECDVYPNEYNEFIVKKLFVPALEEMYTSFPDDVEHVMQNVGVEKKL